MTKKKKDPRGGPGRNQGRKKGVTFTEPTRVIRVPVALFPEIEKMISERKINLTVTNMIDYKAQAKRVEELTKEINSLAAKFAEQQTGKPEQYPDLAYTCTQLERLIDFLNDATK